MIPFFSIIIPTYNRAAFLNETVASIVDQDFKNWECIIVDDGSTDNTRSVIRNFPDSRIKYFKKKHEERSRARNFGIARAKGKYICFLDSDDQYFQNHLTVLHTEIEKRDFPVAMFNTGIYENRNGKIVNRAIYSSSKYSHPIYFVWERFLLINSVCVHSDILNKHKFPDRFNVWEDTHLWLRITAEFPFYQIDEVTAQWNIHNDGSVAKAFLKVEESHVIKYLNCISDVFITHGQLLMPYLDDEDMKTYQFKKFKMFFKLALQRKQFGTCVNLYLYGRKTFDKKELNTCVFSLIFERSLRKFKVVQKKLCEN